MKELIVTSVLLISISGIGSESLDRLLTQKSQSAEILAVEASAAERTPIEFAERQRKETTSVTKDRKETVIPTDAEFTTDQSEAVEDSGREHIAPAIGRSDPPVDSIPSNSTAPVTLDELLRQARNTPHLQREALLARLAERRRLAVALRSTLEAAEQVAAFGKPGAQLLQDASLDTIVDAMIEEERRERLEHNRSTQSSSSGSAIADASEPDLRGEDEDSDAESGFAEWQPVYVVKDARGHTVGWRHEITGERKITVVGERSKIGGASVTVVGASTDGIGRYIVVNIDGERREIHL